jgi:DNA-binding MarR family transcriptional regulator
MPSRLQAELKQTKPFKSLREEVLLQVARTAAVLSHTLDHTLRVYGITQTQYNVLRILRGAGPSGLCRHEVATRLVTLVPDVSRLLDRMTQAELLTRTRDPKDRRLVKACITEKGLKILAELDGPSSTLADERFSHISDADLRQLITLLEAVRETPPTRDQP